MVQLKEMCVMLSSIMVICDPQCCYFSLVCKHVLLFVPTKLCLTDVFEVPFFTTWWRTLFNRAMVQSVLKFISLRHILNDSSAKHPHFTNNALNREITDFIVYYTTRV